MSICPNEAVIVGLEYDKCDTAGRRCDEFFPIPHADNFNKMLQSLPSVLVIRARNY